MNAIKFYIQKNSRDAVEYLVAKWMSSVDTPISKQQATDQLIPLLARFAMQKTLQNAYIDHFAKEYTWLKKRDLIKMVEDKHKANEQQNRDKQEGKTVNSFTDMLLDLLPEHVSPELYIKQGFYEDINREKRIAGYFFAPQGNVQKHPVQRSSFVLNPLFQLIDSESETSFLMEVDDAERKQIVSMAAGDFVKNEPFQTAMINKQCVWYGNKEELMKIVKAKIKQFKYAYPLKRLGWQPEGFFAWYNCIYNGSDLVQVDDKGIVKHGEKNYFSPAASRLGEDVRDGDLSYENDKHLRYRESSVSFSQWGELMAKAFGAEKAAFSVAFCVMTVFRDIVFSVNNTCPYLYCYGQKQSGKSGYADRISNAFFASNMNAFNLNQGTDFAFFNRLGRFSNVPQIFNEFDEDAVKDTWYRALKGVYDGEGRERGSGKKDRTEEQKVLCTLVLLGQYLSTKDDASVLSRSIICEFQKPDARSKETLEAFDRLVKLGEDNALGGMMLEILQQRDVFKKKYGEVYQNTMSDLKKMVKAATGQATKDRIVRNYTAMLASWRVVREHFTMPWNEQWLTEFAAAEIVKIDQLLTENDALAGFWNSIEIMLDKGEIVEGFDYKIEHRSHVKVRNNEETEDKALKPPRPVLFLRLSRVVQAYQESIRRATGRSGLTKVNIENYIKQDKQLFIGAVKGERFVTRDNTSVISSCFALDYESIGVNLERSQHVGMADAIRATVISDIKKMVNLGVPQWLFTVMREGELPMYCQCDDFRILDGAKNGSVIMLKGSLSNFKGEDKMIVNECRVVESAEAEDDGKEDLPF